MKRFGLEGCEAFIPGLKQVIETLRINGVEKVVIGMPHRGRLNVLANVVRKPMEKIFAEFAGVAPAGADPEWGNAGDVKYHLGTSFTKTYSDGNTMTVSLLANPSHLETVDPVVLGKVRAEQHYMHDTQRAKVCPILIHGDASFAG
jgi:2-oxoglutarate dehydrogenase E1 component